MKSFTVGALALVGLVALGIYFAAEAPSESEAPKSPPPAVAAKVEPAPPSPEPSVTVAPEPAPAPASVSSSSTRLVVLPTEGTAKPGPHVRIAIKEGEAIPELFPHQAERDAIAELAASYDPKEIPKIAAYLKHADPSVREAARAGLVQLGDSAAVPVLTQAAKKATNPEEAALLREAAEFLALPRFSDVVETPQGRP